MRKLWILVIGLIGLAHGQTGNHIHHLFGLKQDVPGILTQAALNQQTGGNVEIETFSANFALGATYAFYNSSNNVFYIDSSNVTISILNNYLLPEIYTTNYSGFTTLSTIQPAVSAMCVDPLQDSIFYAYDVNTQLVVGLNVFGQLLGSGNNSLPGLNDISSVNMVYFQGSLYISSLQSVGGSSAAIVSLSDTPTFPILDSTAYNYRYIYMVADPQFGIYAVAQDFSAQNYLLQINPTSLVLDTIALLPSCTNCATEEFIYDKNGLVIDSDNGHIIISREEDTPVGGQQFFLSTYDLNTGAEIYNVQTADKWSNLIFQKPQDDLVYPGDADHDKLVNMLDIFPIGLRYNDQVASRLEISTDWIGQQAANTQDTLSNGVDKKHADCNGDGQINSVDFDAILENYATIHYSEKSTQAACDFPIYVQFPSLVKEDEPISIQLGLDLSSNPNQEVYGLVFTLEYDDTFVDTSGIVTQGGTTWFGTEDGDYVQRYYEESPGRVAVGVVGIDQVNRIGGGGILLEGIWTMEDVVIPIAQGYSDMNFTISNVSLIDYDENLLDACGLDTVIRVYDKTVGIQERSMQTLPLFPNPSNQNYIKLGNSEQFDSAEMYDIQGRMIKSWNSGFDQLYLGDIPKGIYMIKAYVAETVYINKLVYTKE